MNFKKIKKPLVALFTLATILIGCKQEEVEFSLPSHSVTEVSHQYQGFTVSVNQEVSFADLSTGVVDRTWSLDDGVIADVFKLDKDVPDILEIRDILRDRANLTDEEYAEVREKLLLGDQSIIPTYKDYILKLAFPNAGVYTIYLNQVFENNAYVEDETEPRDTNVIDRFFTITVTDRVSFQNITVSELDNSGNPGAAQPVANGGATATVTAGKTARVGFTVTGSPDNIEIESGSAKIVDNSLVLNADGTGSIDIKYSSVGQYSIVLTATRSSPAANLTTTLSNVVEVIPSTEPVTLDKAIVNGDLGLTLTFSREMEANTLVAGDFSVDIKDKNGVSVAATVGTAELDSQDPSILHLTLDGDKAYDDDTVTVSYTKNAFSTTDGVALESVSDYGVLTGQNPNLIAGNGEFENTLGLDWKWIGNMTIGQVELVDPPTPVNTTSVTPSGKVAWLTVNKGNTSGARNNAQIQTAQELPIVKDKSYRIKFKRYVQDETVSDTKALSIILRFINSGGLQADQFFSITDASAIDSWIQEERVITANEDGYVNAKLTILPNWTSWASFYIDDVVFQEYNLRP